MIRYGLRRISEQQLHVLHLHILPRHAIYDHLPRQRQLGAEVRAETEGMLKAGINIIQTSRVQKKASQ